PSTEYIALRKFGELGKGHTTKKNSIDDGGKYLIHLNLKLKFLLFNWLHLIIDIKCKLFF
ncbi:MAG: hypothetical protein VW448_06270, partial [Gammaproteobacteria bacterium]